MCAKNGKAGLIGEHSMSDGMPMIDLANYLTKNSYSDAKFKSSNNNTASLSSSDGNDVQNIFKDCINDMVSGDSKIESMVTKGEAVFYLEMFCCFSFFLDDTELLSKNTLIFFSSHLHVFVWK